MCDDFVGPCIHGRDPYTRCDICSGLTNWEAYALTTGDEALCRGCMEAVTRPGSLCPVCAEEEAREIESGRTIAALRARVSDLEDALRYLTKTLDHDGHALYLGIDTHEALDAAHAALSPAPAADPGARDGGASGKEPPHA